MAALLCQRLCHFHSTNLNDPDCGGPMNVWSQKNWSKVLFCSSFLINHHATDHRFCEEVSGRVCVRPPLFFTLHVVWQLRANPNGEFRREGGGRKLPALERIDDPPDGIWELWCPLNCESRQQAVNFDLSPLTETIWRCISLSNAWKNDPIQCSVQGNDFPQNISNCSVWIRLPDQQQIQHFDNHKPSQLNANYGVKLLEDLSAIHFVYVTFLECVHLEWLMS